ncbi:hypothetical protein VTN00DRAFT_5800 [Thermoascus crustaceus]|uniref:uncharacterized protein n=1 Tax=Thermoascus crustaceus TaxID=5088 RepID=UPI0037448D5C
MAKPPTPRLVLVSAIALVFIIFVLFFEPQGPPSPAARAPGHLEKSSTNFVVEDEMLKGGVVMPKLGNETAKAELGRATWKFFHTMMARYPEHPTEDEQETLRSFVYLFSRLYPCGECASHFQQHLKKYPPQVSSRNAAAGWACFIHNEVNAMLHKPMFDCNKIGDFYDCGCADEDNKTGGKKAGKKSDIDEASAKSTESGKDVNWDKMHAVEISKEPPMRGG